MTGSSWKKVFFAFCMVTGISLFADGASETKAPVPYDADLFSKDRETIFLETEFLFWTVLEGDLQYITRATSPVADPEAGTGALGEYRKAKFHWRPGFRVALGYFNAPKYWETILQYTWYYSMGDRHNTKSFPGNQFLQPVDYTGLVISPDDPIILAKANINFRFNDIDAMVDRVFFPNNHLRIKVLGGLTAAWMDQHLTVRTQLLSNQWAKNTYHWNYWGAGFRLGFNTDWYWGKNFYFSGRMSGAILVGRWFNRTKAYKQPAGGIPEYSVKVTDADYDDFRGAYNFQFLLGPSWQQSYENKRFELFLGYEINSWFNVAEIWRYNDRGNAYGTIRRDVNQSAVTMNGVNLRFTVDF